MKKYLGSCITAFAGVVIPVFIVASVVFAAIVCLTEISGASIFITLLCVSCACIWCVYIKKYVSQIYSWGIFEESGVIVKTLGKERFFIDYSKCKSIGIGSYTHGILNSNVGSRVYFIYFSYDKFDKNFKTSINLWHSTQTRIKVRYEPKLFWYLMKVLPQKQSVALERDLKLILEGRTI